MTPSLASRCQKPNRIQCPLGTSKCTSPPASTLPVRSTSDPGSSIVVWCGGVPAWTTGSPAAVTRAAVTATSLPPFCPPVGSSSALGGGPTKVDGPVRSRRPYISSCSDKPLPGLVLGVVTGHAAPIV